MVPSNAVREQFAYDEAGVRGDIARSKCRMIDPLRTIRLFRACILRFLRIGRAELGLEFSRSFAKIMALPKNISPSFCIECGSIACGNTCHRPQMGLKEFPIGFSAICESVCIEVVFADLHSTEINTSYVADCSRAVVEVPFL